MRQFTLSAALAATLLGTAIAGAGLVGTYSIVGQLVTAESNPSLRQAALSRVSIDGRVPIRLRKVEGDALVPAEEGTVTFVRDGEEVARVDVAGGGTVQATGIAAGNYSLFIQGTDGFAAFSTRLDAASADLSHPAEIISVGLVPKSDMPIVQRIIREHRHASSGDVTEDNQVSFTRSRKAPSLARGNGLQLSSDGSLKGRVVRGSRLSEEAGAFRGVTVCFIRDNSIVAESTTDADGVFVVSGLDAGVYSMVVAGQGSFLAMSVAVTEVLTAVAHGDVITDIALVAQTDGPPTPEVYPVYPEDIIVAEEWWIEEENLVEEGSDGMPFGDEFAGGGGGGSGGGGAAGGGGAGSGGGGLGALLGVAALGAGIYAITDDGGGRRRVSPPAP